MTEINKILEEERRSRRRFLKNAGTIAVTAPAVAILLSSEANAGTANGSGGPTTTAAQPQAF